MANNVDVSDHTQEWLSALAPALSRGLEQVGLAAEGHAKVKWPVDTGRPRNSITHAQLDNCVKASDK
jgi:hypothetical protein